MHISMQQDLAAQSPKFFSHTCALSSKTDQWETPRDFFASLDAVYHFQTDVCADHTNAKCAHYYTVAEDGLKQEWTGVCWMNPPYGRDIARWIQKAYEASLNVATVVCLLPSRTDTKWFHDYCQKGDITFVKGRLKFGDGKNAAPFGSMVVVFSPVTC